MSELSSFTVSLIASGKAVRVVPCGVSMRPLLDGRKDSVVVAPLTAMPKKNSLVLYRDEQGDLTVHRVCAVDRESGACDLLGDGNLRIERGIARDRVYGQVTRICRGGREFSVKHPLYRCYVWLWRLLYRRRRRLLRWL